MIIYLTLVMLLIFNSFCQAQSDMIYSTRNGQAEFTSSVPLHEFTGESSHLTGMIDIHENIVDFYLDLSTLKTGNERRDRDMYRTLNIDEYPFAEFTGSLDTPFDLESSHKQNVTVSGEFTLHGITVNKVVEGTLQKQGDEIRMEAEWVQDITDHEIQPPGILFYRVRDEMDVRLRATLQLTERQEVSQN